MKEKYFHLFYKVLLNKNFLIYLIQNKKKIVSFHKHKIIYSYIYTYSYINFLIFKLERGLYLCYLFLLISFAYFLTWNYFWTSGRLVSDFVFSDFLKELFLYSTFEHEHRNFF